MTEGPSKIFTRKAVVDQILFSAIVGIDPSQLYPFSMFRDIATGLYTKREYGFVKDCVKARNNRTRNFENMDMSFYQELRPECKVESFYTTGKQKKTIVSKLMATAIIVKQYLKL